MHSGIVNGPQFWSHKLGDPYLGSIYEKLDAVNIFLIEGFINYIISFNLFIKTEERKGKNYLYFFINGK